MWAELRIRAQDRGPWYPDTFRALMAKSNAQEPDPELRLPARFFWYRDDGQTDPRAPEIVFIGGKSWIGVRAYGKENAIFLYEEGWKLVRFLNRRIGKPHVIEPREGDFDVQAKWSRYRLRNLIPRRVGGPDAIAAAKRGDTDAFLEKVTETVESGILEQAARLGVALPGPPKIEDLTIGHIRPVRVKNDSWRISVENVRFRLNLRLGGPWQAGGLRARGFGDIRRCPR